MATPIPPPIDPNRGPNADAPSDTEILDLVAQLLDLLPDFFYVHDEDMVFRYANTRAVEYFKRASREDLIGQRLVDVDPDKAQAALYSRICQEIMREGKPRLTENLSYTRKDGTPGWLRQYDIPFVNTRNGKTMLMGISRDVTSERELQDQRVHAARLEEELNIARMIQKSLTPPQGEVMRGLDVAGYSEPAQYAGGDFYDWGSGRNGEFVCGIGDATGHGVGPALLAASCRAYARVLLNAFSLPEAMAKLNRLMCRDTTEGRFITFAAATVEPETYKVQLLSAGHGPVYILRRTGLIEELAVALPPLGIIADGDKALVDHATLAKGDALILVSDGVYEAHDPDGHLMGTKRLREVLSRKAGATASEIVDQVRQAVAEHARMEPSKDDTTVLVVARA